ncbi:MAG: cytochrome c biogenesis protein CcsA [Planctomycetota bacterium]
MTPDALSYAALACFVLGALAAFAGFRVETFRSNALQFALAGAGLVLKTISIGLFCATSDTHFFNSTADVCGLLAWALSFSYLVALAVCAVRSLGALVLPLVSVALLLSHVFEKQGVDPGVRAGPLLALHILAAFLGYGLFITACGASVLYLEQAKLLKRKVFGVLFRDLPSLERLERLELVCSWLGLGIFAVALAAGGLMAHNLVPRRPFWSDPKTLAAVATFVVFGTLALGRTVHWLHGRAAALVVLGGAVLVLVTFVLSHPLSRPAVGQAFQPVGTVVGQAFQPVGTVIGQAFQPVGTVVGQAFQPVGTVVGQAFQPVGTVVGQAFQPVRATWKGCPACPDSLERLSYHLGAEGAQR